MCVWAKFAKISSRENFNLYSMWCSTSQQNKTKQKKKKTKTKTKTKKKGGGGTFAGEVNFEFVFNVLELFLKFKGHNWVHFTLNLNFAILKTWNSFQLE